MEPDYSFEIELEHLEEALGRESVENPDEVIW